MSSPRSIWFCGIFIASLWGLSGLPAQDLTGISAKGNLDLPVRSFSRAGDDDEDAPEIVELYGSAFEGDGFVFVGGPTT